MPIAPSSNRARLLLATFALGLAAPWLGCGEDAEPARLPNVVLITLDTTRADRLSVYGYERPTTPNLETLAAEGVVYEHAYSTSSWTLPSHASLFTGKFPKSHGMRHDPAGRLVLASAIDAPEGLRAHPLAPDERTLARELASAGYATGAVVAGPWMLATFGLNAGFDHYDDDGVRSSAGRRAADVTDAALAWLEGQSGDAERPFFLFLNYFDPHAPYDPPAAWARSFLPPGVEPDYRRQSQASSLYDAEILYADFEIGRLLRALRERDSWDDTLVLLTSDHGELLGERDDWGHERYLWEPLVHVPFVVKWPGARDAGRRESTPVSGVDVLPMILGAAGLPLPDGVQGEAPPAAGRPLLAEVNEPSASTRTGRWRAQWRDGEKFLWSSLGKRHLFDLEADPLEAQDLATAEPARARRAEERLQESFDALPPAPDPGGASVEIDDDTRRALERMGYLEESSESGYDPP